MKIRRAKKEDAEKIWPIEKESRIHHKKITPKKYALLNKSNLTKRDRKDFVQGFKDYLKDKKTVSFLVEKNGVVVGYIHARIGRWGWSDKPPKIVKIDDLGVLAKYRRQGIAKKLIREVEKFTKSKGVKYIYFNVWKSNVPAVELYSKLKYYKFMMEMVKKLK